LKILEETFGRNSDPVDLQGGLAYGYINQKRSCLGTEVKYRRYRKLKLIYKKSAEKNEIQEKE
ncbi:MAG: hypothetical protein NTZ83_04065, partial [Candidatus Pacearchaeota archaeon]|nr:hypothetical protein [Candidatus Pacearchaeota archaeon]